MKICILIKQVPDKDTSYKINDDNLSINTSDISFVTNESDNYALEEALQLKEKYNGEVVVFTFGSESSKQVLKETYIGTAKMISNIEKNFYIWFRWIYWL